MTRAEFVNGISVGGIGCAGLATGNFAACHAWSPGSMLLSGAFWRTGWMRGSWKIKWVFEVQYGNFGHSFLYRWMILAIPSGPGAVPVMLCNVNVRNSTNGP